MGINCFNRMNQQQDDLIDAVNASVDHFQLAVDYGCKGRYWDDFAKEVAHFNESFTASAKVMMNNLYFPRWMALLFVAVYTWFYGLRLVGSDTMTLGIFL